MLELLQTYRELYPDDLAGRYRLALARLETGDYAEAGRMAEAVLGEYPDTTEWLPLAAMGRASRGDLEEARAAWRRYLLRIPETERKLYEDPATIGADDALTGSVWKKRDGDLLTGGRLPEIEHYRRVWYARHRLSENIQPWDLRGEIYIRYGEPDYRSRSGRPNELPNDEVYRAKERGAWNRGAGAVGGVDGRGVAPA